MSKATILLGCYLRGGVASLILVLIAICTIVIISLDIKGDALCQIKRGKTSFRST